MNKFAGMTATDLSRPIMFFRDGHFYIVAYPANYDNWQAEAKRNPGTTKIVDARTNETLWQQAKQ